MSKPIPKIFLISTFLLALIFTTTSLLSCKGPNSDWNSTVSEHLKSELWKPRDIYDSAHFLMVPLHAAFSNQDNSRMEEFSNHFQKFCDHTNEVDKARLDHLHYLYLASRFVLLAVSTNRNNLVPECLVEYLHKEIRGYWFTRPAWQWDHPDFANIAERIQWKLDNKTVKYSYYRAIIDEDLFTMAVGADLTKILSVLGREDQELTNSLRSLLERIFEEEITHSTEEGWLFQPGVWTDHPDYLYAGQPEKVQGMQPIKVPGISWDSSHSFRWPLFLRSFDLLSEDSPDWSSKISSLKSGLANQFVNSVLVAPSEEFPSFRLTNFMDGRNGVYRWNHATQGQGNGYGPYELTGSLLLGWWEFLDDPRIKEVYRRLSREFPLSEKVVTLYIGPGTNRDRHPLVKDPAPYTNGYFELIAKLASE